MTNMGAKEMLKAEARRLGFSHLGITALDSTPHAPAYLDWLERDWHASMAYLCTPRAVELRLNPQQVFPPARSLIIVTAAHPLPSTPNKAKGQTGYGLVAAYARGIDYHSLLPPQMRRLVQWIQNEIDPRAQAAVYTDTGPILERDFASRAGLGWIGKNTCLINPQAGSYLFLAEIFLSTPLEPDNPFDQDLCGTCRRCIEACPTSCISEARSLDARRCISYLTIENKGEISPELRPLIGSHIFGCDICQQVCPWNQKIKAALPTPLFQSDPALAELDLAATLRLSPQEFNLRYRSTPLMRAKRRGLLRSAAVVAGNQRAEEALPALMVILQEEFEPLVRAHAAWALGQFNNRAAFATLEKALETESDPTVLAEIRSVLDSK